MRRHAFSLIELLVVVGVITILAALLVPAVGMVRTSQRRTETLSTMDHLQHALDRYLATWPLLGEGRATDPAGSRRFAADPLLFLARRPGAGAELDLPPRRLLRDGSAAQDGSGPFASADAATATHIADAWGMALVFDVIDAQPLPPATRPSTVAVRIRSQGGTPDPQVDDDLVSELRIDGGGWRPQRLTGISATGAWICAPK